MSPHCDQQVLHAPGECDVCDKYAPERQLVRIKWGICFTGHDPDGTHFLIPCPSTKLRTVETINKWPGNRAVGTWLADIADKTRAANQNRIDALLFPTCKSYRLTWRERIIALFTGEYIGEVNQ